MVVSLLFCHLLDTAGTVKPAHGTSYIGETAQLRNTLDHVFFPGSSWKQLGSRRSISETDVCLTQAGRTGGMPLNAHSRAAQNPV